MTTPLKIGSLSAYSVLTFWSSHYGKIAPFFSSINCHCDNLWVIYDTCVSPWEMFFICLSTVCIPHFCNPTSAAFLTISFFWRLCSVICDIIMGFSFLFAIWKYFPCPPSPFFYVRFFLSEHIKYFPLSSKYLSLSSKSIFLSTITTRFPCPPSISTCPPKQFGANNFKTITKYLLWQMTRASLD